MTKIQAIKHTKNISEVQNMWLPTEIPVTISPPRAPGTHTWGQVFTDWAAAMTK